MLLTILSLSMMPQDIFVTSGQFIEVIEFKHHVCGGCCHADDSDLQTNNNLFDKAALPSVPPLKLFTGCDEYLREYFGNVAGKRKQFLLYGVGGIGKSQICLEFIEENVDL